MGKALALVLLVADLAAMLVFAAAAVLAAVSAPAAPASERAGLLLAAAVFVLVSLGLGWFAGKQLKRLREPG